MRVQAGDCVDEFGPLFLTVELAGLAGHLDGLGSVREQDPGGDGEEFEGAFFDPAVTPVLTGVPDRDVCQGRALSWVRSVGWLPLTVRM
ncbi:MAG: hypothetical protein M3460_08880 [Actinomycetota bacterium]|nr:hypothetical protein [Actinomycetota bacterium]